MREESMRHQAQAPPILFLHLLLLLLGARVHLSGAGSAQELGGQHRCEAISIDMCVGIGYNVTTRTQNLAGHADQRDAEMMLASFTPLIQYQCSRSLRFFLCSVLTPMCDPKWPKPIGPCRPLCQRVHSRCYPILRDFGFEWPAFLNCSNFPVSNDRGDHMCMEGSPSGGDGDSDSGSDGGGSDVWQKPQNAEQPPQRADFWTAVAEWRRVVAGRTFRPDCGHMRNRQQYLYLNHTGDCVLLCHGQDLFTEEDRRLAELWAGILAGMCLLSSLATVLTFLIDRQRFRYPVRPVLFMSACYLCYSAAFFVRILAGREAAACDRDPVSGQWVLIRHGLDNTNCAVVFLLQYFFSTAANAWYVVLVITWLLQAGWKWSPEAVARRSCYFHLPAWLLPVGLTVCVLIVRRVEADELLGMCGVGGQTSADTLLGFVVLPQAAFLAVAVGCLGAGFVAMSRVRRQVRLDGQKTGRFDILMGKIGLFSALYVAPTACLTGLNLYELAQRDLWHVPGSPYRPSAAIFLIRVFAALAIGLTTVLWIVGGKTLDSWRRFLTPGRGRTRGGLGEGGAARQCQKQPQLQFQGRQQNQATLLLVSTPQLPGVMVAASSPSAWAKHPVATTTMARGNPVGEKMQQRVCCNGAESTYL